MDLKAKVLDNVRSQIKLQAKVARLQEEIVATQNELQRANGGMNVLAELYEEEHGVPLQDEINKNEEWRESIDAIRQEELGLADGDQSVEPKAKAVKANPAKGPQATKTVSGNRDSTPRGAPMKISVDGDAPVAPDGAEVVDDDD